MRQKELQLNGCFILGNFFTVIGKHNLRFNRNKKQFNDGYMCGGVSETSNKLLQTDMQKTDIQRTVRLRNNG